MFRKMYIIFVLLVLATSLQSATLAKLYATKGQADKELQALVKKFPSVGFTVAAKNEHLEMHYYKQFHEKNLDLLDFFRTYNRRVARELLLKNPDYGAYTPFNFLAYKMPNGEGSDMTWYGHVDSDTMLNIIGEKDGGNRELFKDMLSRLDSLMQKEMKPAASKTLTFDKPLPKQPLLKMVKKIEDTEDIDSFVESFIMEHDSLFTKHKFVIAGFLDVKFEYDDMGLDFDKYDAYWVSSLCHFEFSNTIFNHGDPQAGIFAPCSIYFYIPKGSNELHVGYAKVENWIVTTGIKDPKKIAYMKRIANEVHETFLELGFEDEVPQVSENKNRGGANEAVLSELKSLKSLILNLNREVQAIKTKLDKLEKSSPKSSISQKEEKSNSEVKKVFKTPKMQLGDNPPEKLTAYYAANPQKVDILVKKLKENGFEILSKEEILKGKIVITVTNDLLKKSGTFIAALNILVDDGNEIRVQNPTYFGAAYLRDDFKYGQYKPVLESLQKVLGDMYQTEDVIEYSRLKDFSFVPEMAHYSDIVELGDGNEPAKKIESEEAKRYIAYTLKLPNGAILVGHKMRMRNNKFLQKIGEGKNAQLLPYQSMVKDDKAYILDPTYYLALSLPLLTMEDFMKIASTPDQIAMSIRRVYR